MFMFKEGQKWYRNEEVADSYDQERFTQGGVVLDRKERETLLSLVEPDGKKVLDIATGTGRFARTLSDNGGDVVGIDASREMLRGGEAEYVQGDALRLPFKNKGFDVAVSMRFLHLLEEEQIIGFIEEVARVTKNKFVFESLHPMSLRIFYQWILPQDSHLYSNSLLQKKFDQVDAVVKVKKEEKFAVPYGLYQRLPKDLAEEVSSVDDELMDRHTGPASTVYWELFFE